MPLYGHCCSFCDLTWRCVKAVSAMLLVGAISKFSSSWTSTDGQELSHSCRLIAEESVSAEAPAADSVIGQEVDDPVTHSGSVNFSWITPSALV